MYESQIEIDAPPDAVWAVLTDLPRWPAWRSAIARTEGTVEPGSRIKVWVEANPGRAFPLTVTELTRSRRMVLQGGMPLGLFRGVRTYDLDAVGPGRTHITMREVYSGPLARLITRSIPDLQPSFDTFVQGLKDEAEAAAATDQR